MWKKMEYEILAFLKAPGGASWWQQDECRFSREFAEWVKSKLETFDPPAVIPTVGRPSGQGA
jgi:hypothetical protein